MAAVAERAGQASAAEGRAPLLRFLGAAGTVTGSRFLVETAASRVLVDCGLFQGIKRLRLRNWDPFPVEPATIDAVIVTHAHLDHVGYLPPLVRDGFRGAVYCTASTATLAQIVLEDSARLHEEEAAYANRKGYSKHHPAMPLYSVDDAAKAQTLLTPVGFDRVIEVGADVRAALRPAGHILGSATVTLDLDGHGRTVMFTGDLGRPNHPLLRPPAAPPAADVVVTESTYGDRRHDSDDAALAVLESAITRAADRGGTIIIPAFAVDRTEVVLLALGRLVAERRIPQLPIHVDSPMALAVLDVYRDAVRRGDVEIREGAVTDLLDAVATLHAAPTPDDSRALNDLSSPAIIISASGMATGGRVLHHLARRLPDPRSMVVLSGFQAAGTRGEMLASGATELKLLGRYVPVRAGVVQINGFSVHADADELVGWLGTMPRRPDQTFAVHGEPQASAALCRRLATELGWPAVAPRHDERVRID